MMYRLPNRRPASGSIATAPLRFSFEGREYQGYAGDTISSALAAAGVLYLGRSFKYHRPRGILSFANHDATTCSRSTVVPNVRGDVTPLRDGHARVGGQHRRRPLARRRGCWIAAPPSAGGFLLQGVSCASGCFRAGSACSARSGLGRGGSRRAAPDARPSAMGSATCWSSARARAASRRRWRPRRCRAHAWLLVDESRARAATARRSDAGAAAVIERSSSAAITLYRAADRRRRLLRRPLGGAGRAGAHDQDACRRRGVCHRRDRTAGGVPQQRSAGRDVGSGAQRLLHRYGVAPGRRVAHRRRQSGGLYALPRTAARGALPWRPSSICATRLRAMRRCRPAARSASRCCNASAPYEAIRGADDRVAGLLVAPLNANGQVDAGSLRHFDCDAILMSVGWAAAAQLLLQAGGRTRFAEELAAVSFLMSCRRESLQPAA